MAAVLRSDLTTGDRVENISGAFRGTIVSIHKDAYKWPYTVRSDNGVDELFNGNELIKLDTTPASKGEVIDALSLTQKEIAETEKKLAYLKTVRKILEGLK